MLFSFADVPAMNVTAAAARTPDRNPTNSVLCAEDRINEGDDFPICVTCGVQYGVVGAEVSPIHCKICEDERQYVGYGG